MAEHQCPFKVIDIEVAGHIVRLPDLPRYQKFYRKLRSGSWEPRTFKVLAAHLDKSTTYLDIGAWIGVTPFWASHIAKSVIAVEPDPSCQQVLAALAPFYPNVEVVRAALSPDRTVTLHAVSGFGSSETSALCIGDGESISVPGLSIRSLMTQAGPGPVFIKIDIEGYEYAIMEELSKLQLYRPKGVQCAVHPQLLESSLSGPKLWRRLGAVIATIRLWRMLAHIGTSRSVPRYNSFMSYVLFGILLRPSPKGTDFLFLTLPRQSLTASGNPH